MTVYTTSEAASISPSSKKGKRMQLLAISKNSLDTRNAVLGETTAPSWRWHPRSGQAAKQTKANRDRPLGKIG